VTTEIPPPEEEDVKLNRYVAAVLAAASELATETLSEAKEVRLLVIGSNFGVVAQAWFRSFEPVRRLCG
jgi:hypothetical protein